MEAPDLRADVSAVGSALRRVRRAAGLSLNDVASRVGLSAAHLSRLESGGRGLSLAVLLTLADELGVSASALLPAASSGSAIVYADSPLVRAADLQISALTNRESSALQPFKVTVPARRSCVLPVVHPGEEWIYVLSGLVTVQCGDVHHTLAEGDSIHFDGRDPHFIVASVESQLIVVVEGSSACAKRGD